MHISRTEDSELGVLVPQLHEFVCLSLSDDTSLGGQSCRVSHVCSLHVDHQLRQLVLGAWVPTLAMLKMLGQESHLSAMVHLN
jgi:hypothetical protein